MTRLDLSKMNKEYVNSDHFDNSNGMQVESLFDSSKKPSVSVKSSMISLDALKSTIKSQGKEKVKALLRTLEIPVGHEVRGQLWTLLCSGITEMIGDDETFQMYANKFANVASERILPINDMSEEIRVHHMLSTEGVKACHRVLYVISETNPHILQFSPLLYAFTSVMLHYLTEQTCFRCIYDLLRKKEQIYCLTPTELTLNASSYVLKDLAFRYMKQAATHIERNTVDGDLASFCNDWVLWIFKHLPFHYLVRIIDCFLVEGYKVLYRVSLILIKYFFRASLQNSSFMDSGKPDAGIKQFCSDIEKFLPCNRLLKEAFAIRGFSKKELEGLFAKNEQALRGRGKMVSSPNLREPDVPNAHGPAKAQQERNKKLLLMKNKKSFKLDKDIHTQLITGDIQSEILTRNQLNRLWSWLPQAEQVKEPVKVFTTNEHGYSLKTFYEKVENQGAVLMIIRSMDDEIFGAYCSTDWVERRSYMDAAAQISYFGTGQSFVFSMNPEIVYPWVGKEHPVTPQTASMFQAGDKHMLMIGGGGGCAIQIDKDFDRGCTSGCDTFDNEPLTDSGEFRIQCVEAFAFI